METNEQKVKQIYQKLQNYLESIESNEEYMKLLKFQARFYKYSANNAMLILLSKPNASYVAGYNAWKKMRRNVRKGETSIRILAPCVYKTFDSDLNDFIPQVRGFRIANVFDLKQTEGCDDDIPEVVQGLSGSGEITDALFEKLRAQYPHAVIFEPNMNSKGSYCSENNLIKINPAYSLEQQTKTFLHEWAHHLCDVLQISTDYATEECIAESVAFIVSDRLGLNTECYSVTYIQSWQKDSAVMLSIAESVQRISRGILKQLEQSGILGCEPCAAPDYSDVEGVSMDGFSVRE